MFKNWLSRIVAVACVLLLAVNSGWIRAASYSLVSPSCDARLVAEARDRVIDLFGGTQADPLLACTPQSSSWLSVDYGRTDFAPGAPPAISIGPKGLNVDVIAHEWAHAELFATVGFFARELYVPTWFDEGLAMQVDMRSDYNSEALATYAADASLVTPSAENMSTSAFFVAGAQGKYHYALSRCVVGLWRSGGGALNGSVEHLDFDAIYDRGQKFCAQL